MHSDESYGMSSVHFKYQILCGFEKSYITSFTSSMGLIIIGWFNFGSKPNPVHNKTYIITSISFNLANTDT